jgi:hypothetical protein
MPDEVIKVELVVTDSAGNRFVGTAQLTRAGSRLTRRTGKAAPIRAESKPANHIDFTLPPRAFIKRYATGMRGPQKFTLLVAKLAVGETTKAVELNSVSKQWSRMTSLMGEFNSAFAVRAGDNGWVSSPKRGTYHLRSSWAEIFK